MIAGINAGLMVKASNSIVWVGADTAEGAGADLGGSTAARPVRV